MNDQERTIKNLGIVARHVRSAPAASAEPLAEAPRSSGAATESPPKNRHRLLKTLGPLGAILLFALGKFKFLFAALKFLKLGTLLTMILSVWAYALFFGFPFALGFVLLIFVHEMGHAVAMRRLGIPASAPVFIPFVGAVIAMKEMPKDAYVEAVVGIGGPALGTLGAIVCLIIGAVTGSLFWYALASTGFLINMFNMLPVSPLDGGRIVGVISRWLWVVGFVVGAVVFLRTHSPILFLVLLLGLFQFTRTFKGPHEGYYDVPSEKRWQIGIAYFGLLMIMALGMWTADQPLEGLRSRDFSMLLDSTRELLTRMP